MATGKSAVSRYLGEALNLPVIDLDQYIEHKQGMTISEIFAQQGEGFFRQLEQEALAYWLAQGDCILSTGGGVITQEHNRKLLQAHSSIIGLQASPEIILQRVKKDGQTRPLLANAQQPLETIKEMLAARAQWYDIAHLQIDTSQKTIEEIGQQIIAFVGREGGVQ